MPNQAPEACPTCGAEPTLRKQCKVCGEGEWVIEHVGGHYMGGAREVVECLCSREGTKECNAARHRMKLRQTGKPVVPGGRRIGPDGTNYSPVTTEEMAEIAAQCLAKGMSSRAALKEAGFPASTVKASTRGINKTIWAKFKEKRQHYIELGEITAEEQEKLSRGRLVWNTIVGTDKGTLSAKQLGADKRVAMWQADSQVGLVVLQAPTVVKLDHVVPLLPPSRFAREEEECTDSTTDSGQQNLEVGSEKSKDAGK